MQEPKLVQQPLDNRGVVLNVEPRMLPPGALQLADNIDTIQEGSITTRRGSKLLGSIPGASSPHTIRKLVLSNNDSLNLRYVGEGENIYRTTNYSSFQTVATLVVDPADSVRRRWNMAPYSSGSSGRPWAFFAAKKAMLKDRGDLPYPVLRRWGILPAAGAAVCQITGQTGSLDGGAPGSPPGSLPYRYRFTWRNSTTGHEGNPSQPQFEPQGPEVLKANNFEDASKWQASGDFVMGASEVLYSHATGSGTLKQTLANMASPPQGSVWYELSGEIRVTNPGDITLTVTTSFASYPVSIPVRDGRFSVMLISKATPGDLEIQAASSSGWLWISNLSLRKPEASSGRTHFGKINVTVWGTDDPQVDQIAIYRSGGALLDGIYRLVGIVNNPGMTGDTPNAAIFTDDVSDESLLFARQLEIDNDPPVTSNLPTPYSGTVSFGGPESGTGWQTVNFSTPIDPLTEGTPIYLSGGTSGGKSYAAEQVVIARKVSSTSARIYLQAKHFTGETVLADFVVAKPVDLVVSAFDSVFAAGDDNNPHVLYKSKTGNPESFPVATEAGTVNQINVGTPANGIVNMCEFGGRIVCLNVSGIFEVPVWRGQMQSPIETPAKRGLYARYAWCKAENTIIYLAYDGIYAWSGGESVKISQEIDPLFRGMTVNGMAPIAMDNPDYVAWFTMEYYRGRIWFNYRDPQGNVRQIVYDTYGKRWLPWTISGGLTALYCETDVGQLIAARYSPSGGIFSKQDMEGSSAATDEFSDSAGSNGTPIPFRFKTAFFDMGDPLESKLFTGAYVEMENPNVGSPGQNNIICRIYYDYSETPSDEFTIQATSGRVRRLVPLPIGSSGAGTPTTGREARAVAFEFLSASSSGLTSRAVFYSLSIAFVALGRLQFAEATHWSDLGHPWDKHLRMVTIEFATFGEDVTVALDTMSGIGGTVYNPAVATFNLNSGGSVSNPVTSKAVFPIPEGTIAKLVRLRPTVESNLVRISSFSFQKDDYPPDFVFHTEPSSWGSQSPKYAQEVYLEVDTGGALVPVKVMADGAVAASITVQTTFSDRFRRISIAPQSPGVMWWISVDPAQVPSGGKFQLFNYQIGFQLADKGAISHTSDWDDLGWPMDKHLRSVTIEFEGAGAGVTLLVDTLTGIKADVQNPGAISIPISGNPRQRPTFGVPSGHVVKMVRLRPSGTIPPSFKIWRYVFDFERYPQDIIYHTEYTDSGYPFSKYYQQLVLIVDTGGAPAQVTVDVDGSDVATFAIQTTASDRRRTLTLPPSISGRQARLKITPAPNGKFQLFHHEFVVSPADKGPVIHTWDWDDLGHPYDKLVTSVSLEYEVTAAAVVRLQGLKGTAGSQTAVSLMDITLSPGGRRKESFALPDSTVVKMVRLFPLSTNADFRYWRYLFESTKYPADVVSQVEWSNLGWPYEKIARWLVLDVDTGGVPAAVRLEADGQIVETFQVSTSQFDRYRILATSPNLIGKMWRITATPGPGGKFQLFSWALEHVKEPPLLTNWRSYQTTFGVESWKFIKQVWVEYLSSSPLTFSIWVDGDMLFYQKTLPAHPSRSTERFYLPAYSGGVANRSKVYVFGFECPSGAKMYPGGTRCEWKPISSDQRASYAQSPLLSGMQFEGVG